LDINPLAKKIMEVKDNLNPVGLKDTVIFSDIYTKPQKTEIEKVFGDGR